MATEMTNRNNRAARALMYSCIALTLLLGCRAPAAAQSKVMRPQSNRATLFAEIGAGLGPSDAGLTGGARIDFPAWRYIFPTVGVTGYSTAAGACPDAEANRCKGRRGATVDAGLGVRSRAVIGIQPFASAAVGAARSAGEGAVIARYRIGISGTAARAVSPTVGIMVQHGFRDTRFTLFNLVGGVRISL